MPDGDQINFAAEIEAVARRLYGEPNRHLSKAHQLRFGTNGSLKVEIAGDNRGTWYDHENEIGGGTLDLIRYKLGIVNCEAIDWLRGTAAAEAPRRTTGPERIIATYDYEDEDGDLLFQVARYEPKDFRQRRPDGRGGWIKNIDGVTIVPYRLPTFAGATGTIYIPEGEKDVEALRRLGFTATCNPMGAGKWPEHFAEHFVGMDVVILPDNDPSGRKHADKVARNLAPVAERVRIVELPDLPHKGDVSDWLAAGGTAKQLCDLLSAAETFDPRNTDNTDNKLPKGFATTCFNTIMATNFEPLRWTIPGYVPEGLSILAGRQKLGKTWLALDFAIAVAIGGFAMGSIECEQGDVLYIDLENGPRRIKRRIETLFPYEQARPDLARLHGATASPQLGPQFIEACDLWRQSVAKPALIVVDVLQRIKPAGSSVRNAYENDYAALADLQEWATVHGVSVLVLAHTKKGGADDPLEAISGSNGQAACADTTLVLDRTSTGITLYVRGRDVDEKETALDFNVGRWTILGEAAAVRRTDERSQVVELLKEAIEPMSPAEIADALGEPRNNTRQIIFKMMKAGEVRKLKGRGRYIHPDRRDLDDTETPDNNDNIDNSRGSQRPGVSHD